MLTDYSVHCPHDDCGWRGCLFPQGNREDFKPAQPMRNVITFCCPRCHREWQARIIGEDAIPLPNQPVTAEQKG
jgi:hypothetical protein